MDLLQKIVNSKVRSATNSNQVKNTNLNLVVEVSDDSDFEDVFVKSIHLADEVKNKKRKVDKILKLKDQQPRKMLKKEFMNSVNIIDKKNQKKLMKKKLKVISIKEPEIPRIPGKVMVRSDEDIIKEYCTYRHKGGEISYEMKRDYFYATQSFNEVRKDMERIRSDVIFNCTIENENLFELLLKGIWMKIKADRYVKKKRREEIRALLRRNDELDFLLDEEREKKKKLQEKLNNLKKLLE